MRLRLIGDEVKRMDRDLARGDLDLLALAQEVAPRKVTVNAVAPGFIETDMTRDLDEKELRKLVPAGRFGKPEEVAALVAFLVSDDAAYITGEVISINGGLYT